MKWLISRCQEILLNANHKVYNFKVEHMSGLEFIEVSPVKLQVYEMLI